MTEAIAAIALMIVVPWLLVCLEPKPSHRSPRDPTQKEWR